MHICMDASIWAKLHESMYLYACMSTCIQIHTGMQAYRMQFQVIMKEQIWLPNENT